MKCWNCDKTGHLARECPNGHPVHLCSECESVYGDAGTVTASCQYCQAGEPAVYDELSLEDQGNGGE